MINSIRFYYEYRVDHMNKIFQPNAAQVNAENDIPTTILKEVAHRVRRQFIARIVLRDGKYLEDGLFINKISNQLLIMIWRIPSKSLYN